MYDGENNYSYHLEDNCVIYYIMYDTNKHNNIKYNITIIINLGTRNMLEIYKITIRSHVFMNEKEKLVKKMFSTFRYNNMKYTLITLKYYNIVITS